MSPLGISIAVSPVLGSSGFGFPYGPPPPDTNFRWDADDLSTLKTTGGAAPVNNDNVASWSGLTDDAGGNGPTYLTNQLNGKPIVSFDGVNDYLRGLPVAISATTAFHYFALIRVATYISFDGIFCATNSFAADWNAGTTFTFTHDNVTAGGVKHTRNGLAGAGASLVPSVLDIRGGFRLVELKSETTLGTMTIDGTDVPTDVHTNSAIAPDKMAMGARMGTSYSLNSYGATDFAELLFYDRVLTVDEITQTRSYLNNKWLSGSPYYWETP